MNDPRRPDGSDPYRRGWNQPTEQMGHHNPQYPDPAYAGQYNHPGYHPQNPTQQLPQYWTQTQQPMQHPEGEPPEPPRSPRWLWLAAGAAVLLVVGMVIALVIADTNAKQDTVVAPLPPVQQQDPPVTIPPSTTSRTPATTSAPSTTTPSSPSTTVPAVPPTSGVSEPVTYTVDGEGRAISITYVDAGGVLQMEFNVVLPWTKEVSLSSPALNAASVTVLNVGREVTCTVSVDGAQVRKRSGTGLTVCASIG